VEGLNINKVYKIVYKNYVFSNIIKDSSLDNKSEQSRSNTTIFFTSSNIANKINLYVLNGTYHLSLTS